MKKLSLILVIFLSVSAYAQKSPPKVDSFFFNLYTDSLKKGFFNYINLDGKMSDGSWMPLDTSHLKFTANTGYFLGNDLFIDSSYTGDSVRVKAVLRRDPSQVKEIPIFIRKRGFDDEMLKEEEYPY